MNNQELKAKVNSVAYTLLKSKFYVAPVDVLLGIGVLTQKDIDEWRKGKVPYLERVCKTNLSKLSLINAEIRGFAKKNNLKNSHTAYMQWESRTKTLLRFSKSGDKNIEKNYSTHFVGER